jgi:NAD(P)H-flavin reductase
MVCGPEVMMRFTVRALQRRGLSSRDVHLSMERNMKCALAFCGRCQYRESFVCKDGPVLRLDRIESLLDRREI